MSNEPVSLTPDRAAVLEALGGDVTIDVEELATQLDEKVETVTGIAFALEEDSLVTIEEETDETPILTDEGREYAENGLPEHRLHDAATMMGGVGQPVPLGDVIGQAGLSGPQVDIALSNFARKGFGTIDDGNLVLDQLSIEDTEAAALDSISAGDPEAVEEATLDRLVHRNLVDIETSTARRVALSAEGEDLVAGGVTVVDEIGQLTPDLLTSGAWEEHSFSRYNVEADAPTQFGGRVHPLRQMAERVKDVLVGMGFQEMEGPHVDADFWINDCLFMPQDHPARTHWDRFELDSPTEIASLPEELVERVEHAHRHGVGDDGEGYHSPWEESVARELALRGHTTSLSARYLAGESVGELEPPQRFFSVEKVYRNDTLDATHLLEFFQIEGWVMAESLSVRDLMGTFTEFYEQFGITDLEFKPHYNPYTEPSFELFGTHPRTGELIEIGNSGIFRPEMLEPLGIEHDVMAWGLALERLLMLVTGAEDIRDVHGTLVDLEFLRNQEVIY